MILNNSTIIFSLHTNNTMDLTDNAVMMLMSSPSSSPPSSSATAKQFLKPPPSQNCLICSEIVEDVENSETKRKVCEIFCRVACRYLNFKIGNFSPPEKTISVHKVNNEDNCGIVCENCFPLAESFCKIYNKFQYLEQLFQSRMKESIDKIQIQMEKGLHDHDDHDQDQTEMEMEGQENRSRRQISFRQKFVKRGKQKLSEVIPILQLDRQGLDMDSETGKTKIAINFLEGISDAAEDFLSPMDPLEIKTEQDFLEFDDDEEESRSSGLSYWCEICNKEFGQISEFQHHRKSCRSETVGRNTEVKHGKSKNSKKYCCKFCGKSCLNLGTLRIHERVHTGGKPYKCRFCERTFAEAGNRSKHERMHTGAMPFECLICGQKFRHSKSLHLHGHSRHPGERYQSRSSSESSFRCGFCGKVFATVKQLSSHQRSHSHLDSNVVPVTTNNLTLVTEKKEIRKKSAGKKSDSNEKEHVCEMCGKCYDHKTGLKIHMRTHTGSFPCKFCGKIFTTKSNLTQHKPIHSNEKPFKCQICGQQFRHSKSLNDHGRSRHPGEKFRKRETYKCSFCDLVFKQLGHKMNHEKAHRNKEAFPFECKICGRIFRKAQQLESHERENHGDHDNAKDVGPSLQASNPGDAVEPGEGDDTQEGDIPLVKVENSSSPEWDNEEMEAALDAALSIY